MIFPVFELYYWHCAMTNTYFSFLQLLAIQNHFSLFPLNVAPVQESGGLSARSTQTHESRTSNIDGTGFNDLEASVFRKLQEVISYDL